VKEPMLILTDVYFLSIVDYKRAVFGIYIVCVCARTRPLASQDVAKLCKLSFMPFGTIGTFRSFYTFLKGDGDCQSFERNVCTTGM
jgi:hypothetical protein